MKGVTRCGERLSSNFWVHQKSWGQGAALAPETLIADLGMCILKKPPGDPEAGVMDSSGKNTVARFSVSSNPVQTELAWRVGFTIIPAGSSLCHPCFVWTRAYSP